MKQLLAILICAFTATACTWVQDDNDSCPYGFWLRLHYSYNILDVDAASKYVTDAYIYIYDADGNYVKRIYTTQDELAANNYRVRVEDLPEGDYQFLVWSGMGNRSYAVAGDTQDMDSFLLSLTTDGDASSTQLPGLYHGLLTNVHYDDAYAEHDVELMKNTNQLACIVVSVTEQNELSTDEYTMRLVSANSVMDARNQLATDKETAYNPFAEESITINDADYGELHGLKYDISTLRLMARRDSRIILEKKSTGQTLINVSIPEYIGMIGSLYTNLGRQLSVQEYLDRQDFYTIVFYLSADLDELIQLRVNNWRLRAVNHLKL
ncbi:MAG: FimB/Mfa2 family fimbrial subunit [Prevotella sp.]|nr:FimB/Mfa2 family fimbrial subunit [Prevotella sp.]